MTIFLTLIFIVLKYAGVLCVFSSYLATATGTSGWELASEYWYSGLPQASSKISSASTGFSTSSLSLSVGFLMSWK